MIITASTQSYSKILELSTIQNKKLGYNPYVYNIDNTMNHGEPFFISEFLKIFDRDIKINSDLFGSIPYKPTLIKKSLNLGNKNVTWMDADAFAIRSFNEVYDDDFDIAVTMRSQTERSVDVPIFTGLLNAGVCFFKNTDNSKKFVDMWINELDKTMYFSDQEALNRLVLNCCTLEEDCYNNIYSLDGIKIKILKTSEYNYYYFPKPPEKYTKILHLKGNLRIPNNESELLNWFTRDW